MSNFTNNIQNQSADGSRREARVAGPSGGEVPFSVTGDFRASARDTADTPAPGTSVAVSATGTGAVVKDSCCWDADAVDAVIKQAQSDLAEFEQDKKDDAPPVSGGNDSPSPEPKEKTREWMLTLSAEQYSFPQILEALGKYDAFIGQLEIGEERGYPHWQMFLQHRSPIAFNTLKTLLPTAHIEPRRDSVRACVNYVTKTETRAPGTEPFSWGEINFKESQGKRKDLVYYKELIDSGLTVRQVIKECPQAARYKTALAEFEAIHAEDSAKMVVDRVVNYLWGKPGVGKTRLMYEKYKPEEMFRVTDQTHPFDNYNGQKVLVWDEFDSAKVPLDLILNITDIYPMELPARYANKFANFTEVWIISNKRLREQYSYLFRSNDSRWEAFERRFTHIYKMTEKGKLLEQPRLRSKSKNDNAVIETSTETTSPAEIEKSQVVDKLHDKDNNHNSNSDE